MSGDDKFLSRWSRRKQEARVADEQPEAEDVTEDAGAADEPEKTDAEILAEHGLKDPDDMGAEDDFSAFMKSAIPARLRNRALRRLWLSNPALANLDALVDYGEDFTDAATVVENLTTAYKVGKGFIDKLVEGGDDPAPQVASTSQADSEAPEDAEDPGEDADDPDPEPDTESIAAAEPEPAEPPPGRRRMAFRF